MAMGGRGQFRAGAGQIAPRWCKEVSFKTSSDALISCPDMVPGDAIGGSCTVDMSAGIVAIGRPFIPLTPIFPIYALQGHHCFQGRGSHRLCLSTFSGKTCLNPDTGLSSFVRIPLSTCPPLFFGEWHNTPQIDLQVAYCCLRGAHSGHGPEFATSI
jgi:hypothetical protein